jgi:aminoglycoside phosphotransferase (APT) family kinase protein
MECPAEDFQHPEKHCKDLIFAPEGILSEEDYDKVSHLKDGSLMCGAKPHELCWVCGWTTTEQVQTTYASRVKCFRTRENCGMWNLGSKLILKDSPNDGCLPGNDYMTQKFLRSQPGLKIPLVKKMELLSEPTDKTHFVVMSRAEGMPLSHLWLDLEEPERDQIRDQLVDILNELRQFTSPRAQKVDGSPLDDRILGKCRVSTPNCKKIGFNTDEWFENIAEELKIGLANMHDTKSRAVAEQLFQKLKDNFPKSEPYILAHGDLSWGNIMVRKEDLKITAILDWEHAGYYPWWAER